ncbi:MAG: immunoglobulin domain-containing protein [Opitutaceae bacterium]|nr:immunoglobulin domain-containing protein [Opitutaceae bacterium]
MKSFRASLFYASLAASLLTAAPGDLDPAFLSNIGAGLTPDSYPTFDTGTGAVNAVALQSDGRIIAGGNISKFNNTGDLTALKRLNADGTLDATFNASGAGLAASAGQPEINALLVEADDKVYIGGTFASYNGVSRVGFAKLNADGTLDTDFAFSALSGSNRYVAAIARQADGKILIGGGFTSVNGTGRVNFARLNTDGSLDPSFVTTGFNTSGSVRDIALATDGRIYAVGTEYNPTVNRNDPILRRFFSDGTRDYSFAPVFGNDYGAISTILVLGDGRVIVGGSFFLPDSATVRNIGCFNADGSVDTAFNSNVGFGNGDVMDLIQSADGRILASGIFTEFGGQSRASIALVNLDGTIDPTLAPVPYLGRNLGYITHFYSLAQQADGRIVAGGWFDHVSDPALAIYNLTRFEGDFTTGAGQLGFTSPGYFVNENGGTVTISVARHSGITGAVSVSYGTSPTSADATDFTAASGTLSWADGEGGSKTFTVAITNDASAEATEIAALLLTTPTGGATLSRPAAAIFIRDDDSVPAFVLQPVGGSVDQGDAFTFRTAYASVLAATVQWQFNSGSGFADIPGATGVTHFINPADPAQHAGAYRVIITNANGTSTSNAVTLAVPIPAGALVGSFNPTLSLTQVISAGFDPVGNILAGGSNGFIRLTAGGAVDPSFTPAFNNAVYSVVPLPDGSSLVGGFFTTVNSTARNYFAHINVDGSLDTTVNFGLTQSVNVLSLGSGNKLYLGHGGNQGVKRYTLAGALDSTFVTTGLISGTSASVQNIKERADGKVFVAYTNGSSGGITYQFRLLTNLGAVDSSFTAPTLSWTVSDWDILPDGRIVIVGRFSTVNGVPAKGIAILNPDGSLDTSVNFANAFTGFVNGVRYVNGRLQVWGAFTAFGGTAITGITRLNLDGTLDPTFKIGTGVNSGGAVNTVLNLPDGRIFVGGNFSTIRGTNRSRVALLEAGPGAVSIAPAAYNFVEGVGSASVTVQRFAPATGAVSVGYTTVNGTATAPGDFIAAAGTLSWGAGDVSDRTVVIPLTNDSTGEPSESFQLTLNGASITGDATLAVSTATITITDDDNLPFIVTPPQAQTVAQGATATFTVVATSTPAATYRWTFNGVDLNDGAGISGATTATLTITNAGPTHIGAYRVRLTNSNGPTTSDPAQLSVNLNPAFVDHTWPAGVTVNGRVNVILPLPDGGAYVGGQFTNFNGQTGRSYLVKINAAGVVDPTFSPAPNGSVLQLRLVDNRLYVLADFTSPFSQIGGGTAVSGFAALEATTGARVASFMSNLGAGATAFASVRTLAVFPDGDVLLGGDFTSFNNNFSHRYLARLNADGTLHTPFDTSLATTTGGTALVITAAEVGADGKIVAGGTISYSGASRFIRFNGDGTRDATFAPAINVGSTTLTRIKVLTDGRILATGGALPGGRTLVRMAADGAWSSTDYFGTTSGNFYDFDVQDNGRTLGVGQFTFVRLPAGNGNSSSIARFDTSGTLEQTWPTGTAFNDSAYTIALAVDGRIWVGGDFTTYNGVAAQRLIRLNGEPVAVAITGQPVATEVNPGAALNFSVTAIGTDPLTYQWRKDGVDLANGGRITGATTANLTITDATDADEGNYSVVITNATAGRTANSQSAAALVLGAPEILVAPTDSELSADTTLTLSATVRGVSPLTYEWRRNGQLLNNGGRISGTDTATLAISSSTVTDGGIYTLTVINALGSVSTSEFNVSVQLQPGVRAATFASLSANGAVNHILILPDGGALVAGEFTSITGANSTSGGSYLVRVKANGEIDPTFTAIPDNRVLRLALAPDGGVIVSGYFSAIGGVAKSRLARLTTSYTVDSGWTANSSLGILQALAIDSTGRIYVGSPYSGYSGYSPLMERFSASGEKDTSFEFGGNSYIYHVDKLLIDAQDRVLVAGVTNPGTGSRGLVRLLPTGNQDPAFSAYTAAASCVSLQADNSIIVGSSSNPTLRRLTPDGAIDNTFTTFTQAISDIVVLYNDRIIAVGSGINNNSIKGIARFNTDGTLAPLPGAVTGVNASATTIAVSETGTLWIGGSFTTYNGATANRILVLNGDVPNLHLVTQPKSQVIDPGTTATFTARAVGTSAISYQWFKDGVALANGGHVSGVTTTTLTLTGAAASDTGDYTVRAANDTGGTQTSTVARLLVRDLPVVLSPPLTLSQSSGSTATFTVAAEGVSPLSYQWNKNGVAISGATGASYTIPSINRTDAGLYSVTITNPLGSVTSESAALSVGTLSGYSPVKILSGYLYDQFNVFAKMPDGRYYVGGSFSSVAGHNTFGLARFNADGTVDTTFVSPFNGGTCSALAAFADGRVFVYGLTSATSYVGHTLVNADGTLATFASTALYNITGTAQQAAVGSDGNIYVSYTYAAGGNNRAMFVKLSPTGDVLAAFYGDGTGGVYDFGFLSGNRIAIAGNWTKSSVSRYVEILDASFVPDTAFAAAFSLNGRVFDLAVLPDGDLLIGGQFSLVNGVSRNYLARINQDGTTDTSFLNGLTGPNGGSIGDIVPTGDGKLLILSSGAQFNGTVVNNFVRISETGVIDATYPLGTTPNIGLTAGNLIAGLVRNDGAIVLAGYNMTFKGTALGGLGYLTAPEDGTLQILAGPTAATQPAGSQVALTVAARGAGPLTFQWSRDGSPISGATGPTYTIAHLNATDEGLYTVTVTSGANSLTSAAAAVAIGTSAPVDTFTNFLVNAGVPENQRGPNDDPDGDGTSNLLEYALALDPMAPDSGSLPEVLVVNDRLTFVYERARNDVTYVVETTTNLTSSATWTSVGVDQGAPDGDGITVASVAMTGSAHFLRLRVER